MKYQSIFSAIENTVWPIVPEKMQAICGFLEARAAGMSIDAASIEKIAAANRSKQSGRVTKSVGVLPVVGVISQRMDLLSEFSGGVSTERLGQEFDAMMADNSVDSIVLDIDSPGGNYYGTPELAEKIYAARGTKPIIAQVNSMAGSAAFWLAAACDEIAVTPSGDLGSHGVMAVHYDASAANEAEGIKPTYIYSGKYKVEGNSDEPLSDEARDEIQRRVNEAGEVFTKALGKYRAVAPSVVREQFGQGRMFGAKEAIDRGMADRIGTIEETIARRAENRRVRSRRRAEADRQRLALIERS
jgi:signal peptide peptidase SppA